VGPTAGVDILNKSKISCPYWDLKPIPSSLVTILTMLSQLTITVAQLPLNTVFIKVTIVIKMVRK
jgi:hypothetical protein